MLLILLNGPHSMLNIAGGWDLSYYVTSKTELRTNQSEAELILSNKVWWFSFIFGLARQYYLLNCYCNNNVWTPLEFGNTSYFFPKSFCFIWWILRAVASLLILLKNIRSRTSVVPAIINIVFIYRSLMNKFKLHWRLISFGIFP